MTQRSPTAAESRATPMNSAQAEQASPPPLFARVLGHAFHDLPAAVRRLHESHTRRVHHGTIEVTRGAGWLSRLIAWLTALPPAGKHALSVVIEVEGQQERWTRRMGAHAMPSRLWAHDDELREQLGPVQFRYRLSVHAGRLRWHVQGVRVLGVLPLPVRWFDAVRAEEFDADGRYRFDVSAALPLAGLLVHYRGALDVADAGDDATRLNTPMG
ncbi:MAG: DUF4166 domain-containing protein [Xanthomonadales bacterium]|nr:DUF4166 domain-containing protein [Xanthomonadales bacterium]